jgi:hypothetical protein
MPRNLPRPHERLAVSEPCSAEWGSMVGNERVRFCTHCQLQVHNLSKITPRQALDLVLRSGGRLCLRIERDPAGLPRTRAFGEQLYQIRRRASRLAAGAFGAALTLCSGVTASSQSAAPEPAQQTVAAHNDAAQPAPEQQQAGSTPDAPVTVLSVEDERVTTTGVVVAVVEPSEPLVKAALDNDLEAVRRLVLFEGADVNVLDKALGVTALSSAYENGNREMMRELLWRGARVNERLSYRQTALMHIRESTSIEAVRDLLDAGAKVNLRDEDGDTALMNAAERRRADIVELLLRAGAKVNARNKDGRTPLMNAAASGSVEAVRALIQSGADVSTRDGEGHSALWHARDNDADEAAALLLAYGADEEPEQGEK